MIQGLAVGRLGLEFDYIDGQGIADDSYYFYAEGQLMGIFLRLGLPIDIDLAKDNDFKTIWETGQFNLLVGYTMFF